MSTYNRARIATAFCLLLGGCSSPSLNTADAPPDLTLLEAPGTYTPDEVVVRFKQSLRSIQGLNNYRTLAMPDTAVLKVTDGKSVPEAVAELQKDPNVLMAEPNYTYHALATPNDPLFARLWGIQKIQVPKAWDTTTGDPSILVGVVDTGVDYNHPDLAGQVIKGPDLVNKDDAPLDDEGHGSHVAGSIAAISNNGVGVAGIAPKSKILAIKALDSQGDGDISDIADGIIKAQQLGARIINLSLGGPQYSEVLKSAVDQVIAKGVLVVAAAGNDGTTTPCFPAAFPGVLSVGATDSSDRKASFSSDGSTLGIAAPGLNILSTTAGTYRMESGTSMASPHVAGAAALLLAKNPNLTLAQLRQALTDTGDRVTGFSNRSIKRLNVAKALDSISSAAPNSSAAPAPTPTPVPSPTGGLSISNVALTYLTSNAATIAWQTSVLSSSSIQYTPSDLYRYGRWSETKDDQMVTRHSVTLSNLQRGTLYYLRLKCAGSSGQTVQSGYYGFRTR